MRRPSRVLFSTPERFAVLAVQFVQLAADPDQSVQQFFEFDRHGVPPWFVVRFPYTQVYDLGGKLATNTRIFLRPKRCRKSKLSSGKKLRKKT